MAIRMGLMATLLSSVGASLLLMFNVINIITPVYIALAFPTALLEIVLAIWLITKGFNASEMDAITKKRITKC